MARWLNETVDVITLDGKLIAEIPAGGSKVTNLCFWGKSAYVTVAERHSIHRLDVGVAGKDLYEVSSGGRIGTTLDAESTACAL